MVPSPLENLRTFLKGLEGLPSDWTAKLLSLTISNMCWHARKEGCVGKAHRQSHLYNAHKISHFISLFKGLSQMNHFSFVTGALACDKQLCCCASHCVRLSGERASLSVGQLSKLICHFRLFKWSCCCFSAFHSDGWCRACPNKFS